VPEGVDPELWRAFLQDLEVEAQAYTTEVLRTLRAQIETVRQ
jgi:hypothetical protein